MAQHYQKIGDYISVVDNRNTDGSITNLMGISIDKCYIPSVANVIGTDLHNYKVIRKGQFACSLMQVSRDQRIPLAMYTSEEPAIMSPAYVMFEVNRPDELLPEYLELWFKRAEFDREASFYAVGGVRGSLDWEDFRKMKLPVPSLPEQRKIVHDYQVITDRIELLRKMNENLVQQGITAVQEKVRASDRVLAFDEIATLFDYMRKPVAGVDRVNLAKIYPYYGAAALMDYIDEYIFDGIFGLIAEDGSVMDDDGHPTLQYVWGKFWVNNHAHIFQGKNGFATETVYLLLKNAVIRDIVTGAVQLKVNQENLRSFKIPVPEEDDMEKIEAFIQPLFSYLRTNTDEIERLSKLADLRLKTIDKGA